MKKKINASVNNDKECNKNYKGLNNLVKNSDEIEAKKEKKYNNIKYLNNEYDDTDPESSVFTGNERRSNKVDSNLTLQNNQPKRH